ncbi:DUF763 domain-containing protein [Apibacter raozihei]|uniref:DUF763 domain-containing protein n=1 Tax=Apibacter raozihei TaxID=2500547 RepID=UPI000FE426AF|nr:DUF763 domain-containing protein [Apibacter raozihei]
MKRGYADLPLHYGTVPAWLAQRMCLLGGAITEAIVQEYGKKVFLQKLSDPFWFQSLGCVLGMDWHSSGITTSVMNALKKSINQRSSELGIYICGGRGKSSRKTPDELMDVAYKTGLNGSELVTHSKLAAKVDNTAVQDGFQLYLHSFVVTSEGDWSIIQQGMNPDEKMARRYHWLSSNIKSFTETPHSFIYGKNQGQILNLTDQNAKQTKEGILSLTRENPDKLMKEISLLMPEHHEVLQKDVNLKRLGAALVLAHETDISSIESLLLLKGVGPRTLQSLTLVSEVIHGTPSRFSDPARFSFAHGGKDGHPFPVPTNIYDETIEIFDIALHKSRLGEKHKSEALKNLSKVSQQMENNFIPDYQLKDWIHKERKDSWKYGGKTVLGDAVKNTDNSKIITQTRFNPKSKKIDKDQLSLF